MVSKSNPTSHMQTSVLFGPAESSGKEEIVLSDADLIARILVGDQDACRALVERYGQHVRGIVFRRTRREVDRADAAQEAWANIFRYLARYKGTAPLRNWIGKIASNTCYGRLRKLSDKEVLFSDLSQSERSAVTGEYERE
jgi:DNA-directed RNA polymerase specialized sigma24 family protein